MVQNAANSGIFISYRRDDTRQAAGRLGDDLVREFGQDRIFRDIERIELGVEFAQVLNEALNNCNVMLVLIGRHWLTVTDVQGAPRLDQPTDWIRTEIVTALTRKVRVVPVLVDGATLPTEAELPDDLRPLVRRQAFQIEDARWRSDVQRLVEGLSRLEGLAVVRPPTPAPALLASVPAAPPVNNRGKLVGLGVGSLVLLLALLASLNWGGSESAAPGTDAAAEAQALAPLADQLEGVWKAANGESWEFVKGERGLLVRRGEIVNKSDQIKPDETSTREVTVTDRTLTFTAAYGAEQWSCTMTLSATGQSLDGQCREEVKNKSSTEHWSFQHKA